MIASIYSVFEYVTPYGITGNLVVKLEIWRILPKIAKFKTTIFKFTGGRNIIAVVATPETPN